MLLSLQRYPSLQSEVMCHDSVNLLMQLLVFMRFLFSPLFLFYLFFFHTIYSRCSSAKGTSLCGTLSADQPGLVLLLTCSLGIMMRLPLTAFLLESYCFLDQPLPHGLLSGFTGAHPQITSSERLLAVQCFAPLRVLKCIFHLDERFIVKLGIEF